MVDKDWKRELYAIYEGEFWGIHASDTLVGWKEEFAESLTTMAAQPVFGAQTGEAYREATLGYAAELETEAAWVSKAREEVDYANEGRQMALEALDVVEKVRAAPVRQTLLQWGWDLVDFTTDHLGQMQAEADEAAQQEAARQRYLAVCDHLDRAYYRLVALEQEYPGGGDEGVFPDPPEVGEEDTDRWVGPNRRIPGGQDAVYPAGYIPGLPGGGVFAPGQDPTPAGVHPSGYPLSPGKAGAADSVVGSGLLTGAGGAGLLAAGRLLGAGGLGGASGAGGAGGGMLAGQVGAGAAGASGANIGPTGRPMGMGLRGLEAGTGRYAPGAVGGAGGPVGAPGAGAGVSGAGAAGAGHPPGMVGGTAGAAGQPQQQRKMGQGLKGLGGSRLPVEEWKDDEDWKPLLPEARGGSAPE
ncbi:MAG: hypothetical protein FWD18_06725 [Micrococcales bacterium]|nr:hypothetical protein [Micrococcales bacterium]